MKAHGITLHADESLWDGVPTYRQIADCAGVSVPTVIDTLRDYTEKGLAYATRPARSPVSDTSRLKVTGDVEAKMVAKACSKAPGGRANWTMTLLSDERAVILETPLSRSTVCRILQRNEMRPHLSEYWCIPPEEDAEFVSNMEDILDLYQHRMILNGHFGAWMRSRTNFLVKAGSRFQCGLETKKKSIRSMCGMAR